MYSEGDKKPPQLWGSRHTANLKGCNQLRATHVNLGGKHQTSRGVLSQAGPTVALKPYEGKGQPAFWGILGSFAYTAHPGSLATTSFLGAARSPGAAATCLSYLTAQQGWAHVGFYAPPLADQASQWTAPSRASVCSFKSTKWAPVISEVPSEHSSYFFQQILLDVCLRHSV